MAVLKNQCYVLPARPYELARGLPAYLWYNKRVRNGCTCSALVVQFHDDSHECVRLDKTLAERLGHTIHTGVI